MRWTRSEINAEATALERQVTLSLEASADAAQHAATATDSRTRASLDNATTYHADIAANAKSMAAALRDGVHPSELGYQ